MKKYLINLVSVILIIEGAYMLFKIVPDALIHFQLSYLIIYSMIFISPIFLILAGIGLFLKENWAIVLSWFPIVLSILLIISVPRIKIPLLGNYLVLVLNIVISVILSIQWRKLKDIQRPI